jgi:hypothetical protein
MLAEFFCFQLHDFVAVNAPSEVVFEAVEDVKLPLLIRALFAVYAGELALTKQGIRFHSPFSSLNPNRRCLKRVIPKTKRKN